MIHKIFKKLLGGDGKTTQILEEKAHEADVIKHVMNKDMARIKKKVDRLNQSTYNKLNEISADLETVTYKIAVATGGRKRGLR